MLPRENRLKKMKDFEILFKEGYYFNYEFLSLKIWKIEPEKYLKRNYTKEDLKVGFTVGLKVSKSAVKRNKIKRQMREVVRLLLKENRIKKGYMIALVAKPDILGKEYDEIEKTIKNILKKAGILI